ncbi:MAG: c-type cytochrome [Bauldia sp.]|nr:c-type cytochrome [Bauldia sp.]
MSRRRRFVLGIAGLVVAAIVAAAGFVWGGFYSVAASAPHNRVVEWLLDIGMQRSVVAHAPETPPPALDDPALIVAGLRHFEPNCAPCHGAPGILPEPQTRAMLPVPPDLATKIDRFNDNELFWIIENGLKYTGMPGWPAAGRDDEVWAVVAFVRLLPGMTAEAFDALAGSPAPAAGAGVATLVAEGPPDADIAACARCHGMDGGGHPSGAFPRIAGLPAAYIEAELEAFATGRRPSGIMAPAAVALSAAERAAVAAYYGAIIPPPVPAAPPADDAASAMAGALVATGDNRRAIPPCASCHLQPGVDAPPLTGQFANYLEAQLRLFRAGTRRDQVMTTIASLLTDAEIAALAQWFAASPPAVPAPMR